jgi:hypothetical protein
MSEHPRLVTDPPELGRELLKFITNFCSADQLVMEHKVDAHGVCPACHWHGPCTIYTAARVVNDRGGSLLDKRMKALFAERERAHDALFADFARYGERPFHHRAS